MAEKLPDNFFDDFLRTTEEVRKNLQEYQKKTEEFTSKINQEFLGCLEKYQQEFEKKSPEQAQEEFKEGINKAFVAFGSIITNLIRESQKKTEEDSEESEKDPASFSVETLLGMLVGDSNSSRKTSNSTE